MRVPSAMIAVELRVSEGSVRRWRRAWQDGGRAGVASRGQAARCRLDEGQLAALEAGAGAGPLAPGWQDPRWAQGRGRGPGPKKFGVESTGPGIRDPVPLRGQLAPRGARPPN